ncbi:MAG: hypothetical protein P8Z00_13705 [Anaerolineales bacterium]|jgi:ribosomal protein S27AE
MKTINNCPECGGDEIYAQAVSAIGMYGPDLLPKLGPGGLDNFLKGKKMELYVCGRCGYIRFFVPEALLADVPKKYQRV